VTREEVRVESSQAAWSNRGGWSRFSRPAERESGLDTSKGSAVVGEKSWEAESQVARAEPSVKPKGGGGVIPYIHG
jgi:hypothetical protein